MTAFREAPRSPTLAALAARGAARIEPIAHGADLLPTAELDRRLRYVAHATWARRVVVIAGAGTLAMAIAFALEPTSVSRLGLLALAGTVLMVSIPVAYANETSARGRRACALDGLLRALDHVPVPVLGWRDYLASARPRLRVVTAHAVDARVFARALRAIDPRFAVHTLDDRTFHVEAPPGTHGYGDAALARRLFDELLTPLHLELGVSEIELGGALR